MNPIIALTAAALLTAAPTQPGNDHERDIIDTAVAAGSFGTLATALQTADLIGALKGDGPFTVFAPTDEAFAKLPEDVLSALLRPENKNALVDILTYHVVSGSVSANQAVAAGKAPSLQKGELSFRIEEGRLRVNESNVIANDIACANGVIHVIDSVLLPPGGLNLQPAGRLVIGVNIERPGRALAEQLGIDRNGSLIVTSVTSGDPAERAGLKRYDVITSIDGQPATNDSLKEAKERAGYQGQIELSIVRRGKPAKVTVDVGVDPH